MNPTVAMSLASFVLTALAIIVVNDTVDSYSGPHDTASPALEIPMLVLLGVFGGGILLFALGEEGGPEGYWIPVITVLVIVPSFILGTAWIG
jgi:hypothetical protein